MRREENSDVRTGQQEKAWNGEQPITITNTSSQVRGTGGYQYKGRVISKKRIN